MNELVVIDAGDGVRFRVRVNPRASRDSIVGVHDGALKVALTAPPVDGAANAALVVLLAKTLGVPRRAVRIAAGESAREKRIEVSGLSAAEVRAIFGGREGGAPRRE